MEENISQNKDDLLELLCEVFKVVLETYWFHH